MKLMDQEKLKSLLKGFIRETENDNVTSADELIHIVANELQKTMLVASNRH